MKYQVMSQEELANEQVGGVVITLASVLAILASAAIAVVVYKVFLSKKGSATIGGWKFTWN